MQTNLASSSKPLKRLEFRGFFYFHTKVRPHPFSCICVEGCGLFSVHYKVFVGKWDGDPIPYEFSFKSTIFDNPFPGIMLNILPYFVIILLIADHMVVIGALEYLFVVWILK